MPHILRLFGAEQLEQEILLNTLPIAEIRRLWSLDEDNPVYDSYPLHTETQADFVEQYCDVKLNRQRLGDYHLEFDR